MRGDDYNQAFAREIWIDERPFDEHADAVDDEADGESIEAGQVVR